MPIRLKKGKFYLIEVCRGVVEGRYLGKDRRYRFFDGENSYIVTDDFLTVMIGEKVTHRNGMFNPPVFIPKNTEFPVQKKIKSRLMKILETTKK